MSRKNRRVDIDVRKERVRPGQQIFGTLLEGFLIQVSLN